MDLLCERFAMEHSSLWRPIRFNDSLRANSSIWPTELSSCHRYMKLNHNSNSRMNYSCRCCRKYEIQMEIKALSTLWFILKAVKYCAITSTIFRTLQTAEQRQLTIYSWEICDNFNVKKTINGTTFESHFWQK